MAGMKFKIRRQDDPDGLPYWEKVELEVDPSATVIDALELFNDTMCGPSEKAFVPVTYESSCREGMCGSCTMVINGRVRLACRTYVADLDQPIEVSPLSKFPIIRDLRVDRSSMYGSDAKMEMWTEIGPIDRVARQPSYSAFDAGDRHKFEGCIMCGSCIEACPQAGEKSPFVGAHVFTRAVVLNMHPYGKANAAERLFEFAQRGGVADCGGARNCDIVCPMRLETSEAIGRIGFETACRSVRNFFRT
jgi:succinate dehydrogenase / fumarate reductase iron-sulfur subunit